MIKSPSIARRHLLAGFGGLAAAGALGRAEAAGVSFVRIAGGRAGGSYAALAGALAKALSAPPGSACDPSASALPAPSGSVSYAACGLRGAIATPLPSAGSRANVKTLVDGNAELAFCQADVATWLAKGAGPLKTGAKVDSLRVVASLGTEAVHLLVRKAAGIATPADLRGHSVGWGEDGSGSRVDAELVLGAHGLARADIQPSAAAPMDALHALLAGSLDAVFLTGPSPLRQLDDAGLSLQAGDAGEIALLPLDTPELQAVVSANAVLANLTLPEGMHGLIPSGGLATFGTGMLLVTMRQQRPATVNALTAALWQPKVQDMLKQAGLSLVEPAAAIRDLPLPLHEGAERYYREAGLI